MGNPYYTHWNNYNICKINYQHIASIGVGDGWGVVGARHPLPAHKKIA